jgi:hypothetical protein
MIPGLKPETRALLVQLLGPQVEEALTQLASAPSGSGLLVTDQGEICIYPVNMETYRTLITQCQWAVFKERSFREEGHGSPVLVFRRSVPSEWAALTVGEHNAWDVFAQVLATGDYLATMAQRYGKCLVFKDPGRMRVEAVSLPAR